MDSIKVFTYNCGVNVTEFGDFLYITAGRRWMNGRHKMAVFGVHRNRQASMNLRPLGLQCTKSGSDRKASSSLAMRTIGR